MACCPQKCRCVCPEPARLIGEINIGDPVPFPFTTSASPLGLTPIDPAGTVLNPSSLDFVVGGAGILQYVGSGIRRFMVHGQVSLQWTASAADPSGTSRSFYVGLLVNGIPFITSAWGEDLVLGPGPGSRGFNFHVQRVVQVAPGGYLQMGANSTQLPVGNLETLQVSAFSLLAG